MGAAHSTEDEYQKQARERKEKMAAKLLELLGEGKKVPELPPKVAEFMEQMRTAEHIDKKVDNAELRLRFNAYMVSTHSNVEKYMAAVGAAKRHEDILLLNGHLQGGHHVHYQEAAGGKYSKAKLKTEVHKIYFDFFAEKPKYAITIPTTVPDDKRKELIGSWTRDRGPARFNPSYLLDVFKIVEDKLCAEIVNEPGFADQWKAWYKTNYPAQAHQAYQNFQKEYGYAAHDIHGQNVLPYVGGEGHAYNDGYQREYLDYDGANRVNGHSNSNEYVLGMVIILIFGVFLLFCIVCALSTFGAYLYGKRSSQEVKESPNSYEV